MAAVNEQLKNGTFRIRGKKVETTIQPATDYFLAEVSACRSPRACRSVRSTTSPPSPKAEGSSSRCAGRANGCCGWGVLLQRWEAVDDGRCWCCRRCC